MYLCSEKLDFRSVGVIYLVAVDVSRFHPCPYRRLASPGMGTGPAASEGRPSDSLPISDPALQRVVAAVERRVTNPLPPWAEATATNTGPGRVRTSAPTLRLIGRRVPPEL